MYQYFFCRDARLASWRLNEQNGWSGARNAKKPGVIYSNNPKKLTGTDLLDIDLVILHNDYTYGSPLLPVHHRPFGKVCT